MDTKQIKTPEHGKNKPFIVANIKDILELIDNEEISYSRMVEMFNEVAANYYGQHPVPETEYVLRKFDTNKYYWCKCENCGWEDSSEYAAGGHSIGDTGDYSEVVCPICCSDKIEGETDTVLPEEYDGVHFIKIPLNTFLAPYQKAAKRAFELEDEKHWNTVMMNEKSAHPVPDASQPAGKVYVWKNAGEMFPIRKDYEYSGGRVFIRNIHTKCGGMILIDEFYEMDGKENIEWLSLHPSQPAGTNASIKNLPFYGWKKDGMKENPDDVPMDDVFILRGDVLKVISQPAGNGWVSVEDRLPEGGQKVDLWIVPIKDEIPENIKRRPHRISWTWEKGDTSGITISFCKVTHWMPLPLPPNP